MHSAGQKKENKRKLIARLSGKRKLYHVVLEIRAIINKETGVWARIVS